MKSAYRIVVSGAYTAKIPISFACDIHKTAADQTGRCISQTKVAQCELSFENNSERRC